jgi:uncharacterized membrane protein
MTFRTTTCVLTALLLAASNSIGGGVVKAEAQDATVTNLAIVKTIDVPGATNTFPLDINAAGVIVGRYLMANRTHGFLRDTDGNLTTIDVPGASFTAATAINDRGDIVGQYALATAPGQRHGFLLQDGVFTSFDPPGSTFTNVLDINERGDIVGRYCTRAVCSAPGTGSFHGFLLRDGEFRMLDVPGALETDAFGINGREQIAGGFLTVDHTEQIFLLSHDEFTALVPPDGQQVALDKGGINERGDIVGTYCDVASLCLIAPTGTHGFVISNNTFTPIDIPGAVATAANGINARGDIVGGYSTNAVNFHGFLLSQ